MSNLLEQASLVMIPSGYKEDIVYSVIPTSGAGDLSFTRASNGTRINSAGLVEDVPWNLLQQSETFDNAIWTKQDVTLTANSTTSPDGTSNADKLIVNNSDSIGLAFVQQAITKSASSITYSYTCYAKQSELNAIRVYTRDSISSTNFAQVYYNINDGSVITAATSGGTFSGASSTITSVANGFYRINLTFTSSTDTQLRVRIYPYDTVKTTGNGTDGIFIWGAQLNIGSTAKPYFPTTDRLNVPRLTYQNGGGGCPSLLLEKQSTNLALYSENFNDAYWGKSAGTTVTANTTISPDGDTNADTIALAGSSDSINTFISTGISVVSGTTYTISVFTKSTTQVVYFGGATGGTGTNVYNGSVDYGNGWYRQSVTRTWSASGTVSVQIVLTLGSAGSTIAYGFQAELGAYATSYIPTTSSSATRVADVAQKTGISSLIGQTEGVLFVDFVCNGIQDLYGNIINSEKNVTNSFYVHFGLDGVIRAGIFANSVQRELTASGFVVGQRYKLAFAYKSGDLALYSNGVQKTTSPSSFAFNSSLDDIYLNDTTTYFGYQENFNINEAILFPTRLTNSELAQLTGNQNYTINQAYASYGVASESPNCVQP